jgi:hypothetical protein
MVESGFAITFFEATVAALPPDVRKAYGFPDNVSSYLAARLSVAANNSYNNRAMRKAEPFALTALARKPVD